MPGVRATAELLICNQMMVTERRRWFAHGSSNIGNMSWSPIDIIFLFW